MKKYNIFSLLFVFLLSATSCKDFLEEENLSNMESDAYYATAEGYDKLVNSAYSTLRTVYASPGFLWPAPICLWKAALRNPKALSEYRELTPEETAVELFYRNTYAAIQVCNTALYFNDKTAANTNLAFRKGEVQFLRAYYYFLLVQNFGGVALVTERFTAPAGQFQRNSAQEVYAFIIKEMNEALAARTG